MLLRYNQIYGFYEKDNFTWIAEHGVTGNNQMGIYKCVKGDLDLVPYMVSYATQINNPFVGCLYDGNFGNIAVIEPYLFVPYYKRSGNSWDIIVKYTMDLFLVNSKSIQKKGIVQDGYFKDATIFNSFTYKGLWTPVLTTINNLLYYLIDNITFIINPNDLSIIGQIAFDDNFKGFGIVAVNQKGTNYIGIVGDGETRFVKAGVSKLNCTDKLKSTYGSVQVAT